VKNLYKLCKLDPLPIQFFNSYFVGILYLSWERSFFPFPPSLFTQICFLLYLFILFYFSFWYEPSEILVVQALFRIRRNMIWILYEIKIISNTLFLISTLNPLSYMEWNLRGFHHFMCTHFESAEFTLILSNDIG
jgi:hypothetical protein